MNRMSRFCLAAQVAMLLLMPALSWASWEVVDCPTNHTGYILNGFNAYSNSPAVWGKAYQAPPAPPGSFIEYRGYISFDMTAASLTQGRWVRKADFYYGDGTWASGGATLPSLWSVELYGSLANPRNLHPSDWNGAGDLYAAQITFGTPPGPAWVSLPQSFVDRLNFYGGQTIALHDASHSSQDGFYSGIPRGCFLRLTIEDVGTGGKVATDLNAGESTASASSTISHIKALY